MGQGIVNFVGRAAVKNEGGSIQSTSLGMCSHSLVASALNFCE
jgi:hypothetical protein